MAKIVVGVDGSHGARRALEWAVAEGERRGAEVEVVHALQLPTYAATPFGIAPIDLGTFEATAQAEIEEVVASVDTSRLTKPVTITFVVGGGASSLLAAARDAELLVVGTRGRGGFAGLLLGSVSQQVVHHAPCPVVIVPPDDEA